MSKCFYFHIFYGKRLDFSVVPLLILLPSDILNFLFLFIYIFLLHKSLKNLSNGRNFGHVFGVSNLRSQTKNCDRMMDIFYRAHQNLFESLFSHFFWLSASISRFFVCCCWKDLLFMVILLLIVLPCDNLKFVCLSVYPSKHLLELKIK